MRDAFKITEGRRLMKERPILFSAPMVRAILAGQKTQTRRIAKPVRHPDLGNIYAPGALALEREPQHVIDRACPYGQPGDLLWVKETTLKVEDHGYVGPVYAESDEGRDCLSGGLAPSEDDCTEVEPWEIKRRPSIFMPRSMARMLLEVVSIRVERLQDISEADAMAEGSRLWASEQDSPARDIPGGETRLIYRQLWESINGDGSWGKNPWVWVVEFDRIEPPKGES